MIVSLEPELVARLSRLDSANQAAADVLDEELATAVRRAALMRRMFYAAVLAVALYGTATGAVAEFGLPWWVAIGGIFALELGGVVFLSNADIRRRLGEQAVVSRLLGAVIAGAAATFNLLTHHRLLLGGFFALMSVLGFVTWWLDVENKRRDRLRARGQLAAAAPGYEIWTHWLRHPFITARARSLAKAHPQLGLYGSLEAATIVMRRERRNAALAKALRARIRKAVGKHMAGIAELTFDMDEVAARLRRSADYDGLTALVGSELTAERVLHGRDDQATAAARAWLSAHSTRRRPQGAAEVTSPFPRPAVPEQPDGAPTGAPTGTRAQAVTATPAAPADAAPTTARQAEAGAAGEALPLTRLNGDAHRTGGQPSPVLRPDGHARAADLEDRRPSIATDERSGPLGLAEPHRALTEDPPHPRREGTGQPSTAPTAPPPTGQAKVTARILGEPALLDRNGVPARGLRAKSVELLVYLAVHRAGAPLEDIVAALWPDVPARRAVQRLSTCLGNLRTAIRTALSTAGGDNEPTWVEPVVNTGSYYRLDPAVVEVDWWRLLEQRTGTSESADRTAVPHVEAATQLAAGCDYPWLHQVDQPTAGSDHPDGGQDS